jgi:alpha-tubulin suppressor-like RCC1 family protein
MITLRLDKGSPLTTEEMDNNLIDLSNRVDLSTDQTIYGKLTFTSSPIVTGILDNSQSLCTSKYAKDTLSSNVITTDTLPLDLKSNLNNLSAIIYVEKTVKKVLTFNNGSWLKFINPTSLIPSYDMSYIFQGGRLYGSGYNNNNSLSSTTTTNFYGFFDLGVDNIKKVYGNSFAESIIIELNDNTIWSCGYTYPSSGFMQAIPDFDNPINVYCGYNGLLVEKSDGTFWGCGYNDHGQYGTGGSYDCYTPTQLPIDPPLQISMGYRHTIIQKTDGTVWGAGNDNNGQLGLNANSDVYDFTHIIGFDNARKIACGYAHTFIEKSDGTVWGTGANGNGGLGLGDTLDRTSFEQITDINNPNKIACGYYASFVEKSDGSVWSCGYNGGQLGLGDTLDRNVFTQIPGILNPNKMECGYGTLFIEKSDGSLWSCGYTNSGQLGGPDENGRSTLGILL